MDITKDIQPMTTFRNHSAEIMQHLKDTKRPVILTVNSKARRQRSYRTPKLTNTSSTLRRRPAQPKESGKGLRI